MSQNVWATIMPFGPVTNFSLAQKKFRASQKLTLISGTALCYLLITPFLHSDYPFVIFWLPLLYILITPFLHSDYPFVIFWLPLFYLLITPLLSSDYPFFTFWLPLCYLLITPLLSSDYPSGIFKLFLDIFCIVWLLLFLLQIKSLKYISKFSQRTWFRDS